MGLLNGTGVGNLFGGLFGGLKGGVKTITSSTAGQPYRDTLTAGDLIDTDTVVTTTEFTRVQSGYTIPYNQQISIGYGKSIEPDNAGYVYVQVAHTDGSVFYGKIRVVLTDFNDIAKGVMFSADLKELNGSLTSRTSKVMIPENTAVFGYFNDKIFVEVQGATASTVDNGLTVVLLPITRRYLQ